MREENIVRYSMIKKAYYDLQQLSEYNVLKAAEYINDLREKQEQAVKMIKTGIELGE